MTYESGQRVIYTKRGESRFFDTEWPGTYRYMTPAGKHAILLDGRKRLSLVGAQNLRAAPETRASGPADGLCGIKGCTKPWRHPGDCAHGGETRIEEAVAVCSACGVSGSGGLASGGSTVTIRCNKPYCPGGTSANRGPAP